MSAARSPEPVLKPAQSILTEAEGRSAIHPGRSRVLRGTNALASTKGPLANLGPTKTTMLPIPVVLGYRPRCKPLFYALFHLHAVLCFLSLDLGYHRFFFSSPPRTLCSSVQSILSAYQTHIFIKPCFEIVFHFQP